MTKYFFLPLIFAFLWTEGQAQSKSGSTQKTSPPTTKAAMDSLPKQRNLHVIGRSYGDSIVLRWAPSKPTLWYFANKAGYVIWRYEIENKKINRASKKVLTPSPLKPWTLEEWKTRAQRNDSLAAACAQLVHGQSKEETNLKKKGSGVNLEEELNKNVELENKHGLALYLADQSVLYANGLGLRLVDKGIAKGKSYTYAIFAVTDPKIIKSDTTGVYINTAEVVNLPEMPPIKYESGDRTVKFIWSRQLSSLYFTSYYYERSEDEGKTFQRLNQKPYLQLTKEKKSTEMGTIELNDSLPRNYVRYHYRIIGVTPFGDLGKPSQSMLVIGKDLTPPSQPVNISAKNTKGRTVKITWVKGVKEQDFAGFLVGKSSIATGPFEPLHLQPLSVAVTDYTDTSASLQGTNYYTVTAIDTAGNGASSIPAYVIMIDSIGPAKPIQLSGKIDTNGIVNLKWKLGKEEDLMGYLVYASNDPSHRFVPVGSDFLIDSSFTDSVTLKTLTEKRYYKVVAFDRNRNPSAYSEALELKRPDKIPPVTPVFNQFQVTDSAVVLHWATSTSKDVVSQVLYRREKDNEWEQLTKLETNTASYTDKKVTKRSWYEYALEAVDDAGLHSPKSFPLNVRVYDSGQRPSVKSIQITKSADGKGIELNWKYPYQGEYWFVIYRSENGGQLKTYKNLPATALTFSDRAFLKGAYQYGIKVVYKDGGESIIATSTPITFESK